MRGERTRPLWREPVLIAAAVVMAIAAVVLGVSFYGQLAQPVARAPTDDAGVPLSLPDGTALPRVPSTLSEAVDRPVVLVGSIGEPLADLERCQGLGEWEFAPTQRASVITPEGLTVSIRGEEQGTGALLQVTCYAQWGGRSWQTWASWTADAADATEPLGPPGPICCRDDGLGLGGGEVLAPDGAAWLLQDRGPYWLAYPIDDSSLVHPVWPVDGDADEPPPTRYLTVLGEPLPAEEPDGSAEEPDGSAEEPEASGEGDPPPDDEAG